MPAPHQYRTRHSVRSAIGGIPSFPKSRARLKVRGRKPSIVVQAEVAAKPEDGDGLGHGYCLNTIGLKLQLEYAIHG